MQVDIVVFEGVDELDALGPYEVLANAARLGADVHVRLVAVGSVKEVRGAHGIRLKPDAKVAGRPDVLIVPGGGWNDPQAIAGARREVALRALPDAVRAMHEQGTVVASVCTGALIVGATGLLQGRPAITHHSALDDLARAGAQVVQARVVDDGDLVSCGGVTAGLDLALWLVSRFFGDRIAQRVAEIMEHPSAGQVRLGPRAQRAEAAPAG